MYIHSLVVTIHGLCTVNSNIWFLLYPTPIIAKKGWDVYKKSVQIYVIMLHGNGEEDIIREGNKGIRKKDKILDERGD